MLHQFCAVVLPEAKTELKSIFTSTGQPPSQRIIDIQRNILKLLGYVYVNVFVYMNGFVHGVSVIHVWTDYIAWMGIGLYDMYL
ncbi:hypothetical protein EON63_24405 [archaeon]|nr:MAG: hypothetical protein EON63_24405 [archaeon]